MHCIRLNILKNKIYPSEKEPNPLNSSTSKHNLIEEVTEIVNRETEAWNTKNAELLMTIFHHDMVWAWPRTPLSHDPMDWVIPWINTIIPVGKDFGKDYLMLMN